MTQKFVVHNGAVHISDGDVAIRLTRVMNLVITPDAVNAAVWCSEAQAEVEVPANMAALLVEHQRLNDRIARLQSDAYDLTQQNTDAKETHADLAEQNRKLTRHLTELRALHADAVGEIAELRDQVDRLTAARQCVTCAVREAHREAPDRVVADLDVVL